MADAGRGRAECFALAIVVGVDNGDWFFRPHFHDELSHAELLFGSQAEVRARVGSHRPVDVEPGVKHAHLNEIVDPLFRDEVVDVGLADARADAREDFVVQAVLKALHRRTQHAVFASPFVADDFRALDADQRRDVPAFAEPFSNLVGNEVAIGEDLEVAVRVSFENVEQVGVHERLATDDAEKDIPHCAGFADQL